MGIMNRLISIRSTLVTRIETDLEQFVSEQGENGVGSIDSLTKIWGMVDKIQEYVVLFNKWRKTSDVATKGDYRTEIEAVVLQIKDYYGLNEVQIDIANMLLGPFARISSLVSANIEDWF